MDGDAQIHLPIGKAQGEIIKEHFARDSLYGGHTKEKWLFFTNEWMMEREGNTASAEVFQIRLVEIKEDSFQCCRPTACSKWGHTPEDQGENLIPASAMNNSIAEAQCIAPHTIPPEKVQWF